MQPEHITAKTVLYGCLDWGSGHLARSIPLLLQLERQGNTVFFCGSQAQYVVLQQYGFSGTWLELPETGFRFKGDGNFVKEALRNVFILRKAMRRDRDRVAAYVKRHAIDLVISDHRYGICSETAHSIFVTHQVQLPPGTTALAQRLHRSWMQRFATVWILDDANERLAGELSIPCANGIYIGHYSRFSGLETEETGGTVAIISGPEPYGRQLFDRVMEQARTATSAWTIICSGAYAEKGSYPNSTIIRNDWQQADEAIRKAELIISRNGYSTLMDLKALGKKAIFIPTPGQAEQLYLKKIHETAAWNHLWSFE